MDSAGPLSVTDQAAGHAACGAFRAGLYLCLARRADALFELADSLVAGHAVASGPPPHLSLEPPFRRGWGSTYGALRRGRIDAEALRDLLAATRPAGWPAVFAVDTSSWPRCDAECSPERGYYHHPSRHSAGQPIVAGWNRLNPVLRGWTAYHRHGALEDRHGQHRLHSVVQRKVLDPNQWASLTELEAALLAFGERYSAVATPFEWRFTRGDLRRVLAALPDLTTAA